MHSKLPRKRALHKFLNQLIRSSDLYLDQDILKVNYYIIPFCVCGSYYSAYLGDV